MDKISGFQRWLPASHKLISLPVKCQTAVITICKHNNSLRSLPDARAHWLTLIMASRECALTNSASGSDFKIRPVAPPASGRSICLLWFFHNMARQQMDSSFTEFWCSTMVCIYCFIRGIVKRCANKEAQDQWRRDPGYTLPELEKNTAHTCTHAWTRGFCATKMAAFLTLSLQPEQTKPWPEPKEKRLRHPKENVQSTEEETKDPGCLCMNRACIRCLQSTDALVTTVKELSLL